MKKILNIVSSPRGGASYTIQLADAIIAKIKAEYPGSTVKTVDLAHHHYPHLEEAHISSYFTPAEKHSAKEREVIRHSDEAIKEVQEADILVIGAPMWNFSIPSALKAWIDHIVRKGVTFNYSEKGPVGMLKGKKVYVAISSGGIYSDGPMKQMDHIEPYLRTILGFIGLTDLTVFRVEGLSIPGVQDTALEKAIAGIQLN
ncbi:FMN-dependent NADH-azoreductase [Puia dinghuensis]|uniref:FMN dependent NADH:quinone oxidoreductase n=1 Tax=Puia dinghuensis TaxID=1792502 RepID=A0A8J2UBI1_9BACT|nr:FMN-dependent NADH-azoreductase [Puia dinghuensis]GGA94370.1 FMN-dependent NADH-azoreductase [Puia dinghuensis]